MTSVAAFQVMKLRAETGATVSDASNALRDAAGDPIKAKELLRQRIGDISTSPLSSGKNGLLVVKTRTFPQTGGVSFVMAEIFTQTDFAARSPLLIEKAELFAEGWMDGEHNRDRYINEAKQLLREDVQRGRVYWQRYDSDQGPWYKDIGFYVHHDRKIASVVVLGRDDNDVVPPSESLMRDIAMHIVAVTPSPVAITADLVDKELVEKERQFLLEKATASGKPLAIQQKIIDGGIAKFCASKALIEQPFIKDPSKKIKDILPTGIQIVDFSRWTLGGDISPTEAQ